MSSVDHRLARLEDSLRETRERLIALELARKYEQQNPKKPPIPWGQYILVGVYTVLYLFNALNQ